MKSILNPSLTVTKAPKVTYPYQQPTFRLKSWFPDIQATYARAYAAKKKPAADAAPADAPAAKPAKGAATPAATPAAGGGVAPKGATGGAMEQPGSCHMRALARHGSSKIVVKPRETMLPAAHRALQNGMQKVWAGGQPNGCGLLHTSLIMRWWLWRTKLILKMYGPHHSDGGCCWCIVNIAGNGDVCIGGEGPHPKTDKCRQKVGNVGSVAGKRVGLCHVIRAGPVGEVWIDTGGGFKKVGGYNAPCGSQKKSSTPSSGQQVQFRCDCSGVKVESATVYEIGAGGGGGGGSAPAPKGAVQLYRH